MTIEVARADLEQVAAALDNAVTAVDVNTDEALAALELVQTYLDQQDGNNSNEAACEVQASTANGSDTETDAVEPVAEDDIPF